MKLFEVVSDRLDRIPTGIRKTTVANPAKLYIKNVTFEGRPEDYDFRKQKENYIALKTILDKIGYPFTYIGAASYPADRNYMGNAGTLTRFVVVSPILVWEKYEGSTPGGGQNHIYAGGEKQKLTWFLGLSLQKQLKFLFQNRVLTDQDKKRIETLIAQFKLRYPEQFDGTLD